MRKEAGVTSSFETIMTLACHKRKEIRKITQSEKVMVGIELRRMCTTARTLTATLPCEVIETYRSSYRRLAEW